MQQKWRNEVKSFSFVIYINKSRCLLPSVCLSESSFFFKPCLFRLQNEQEKGGPWSQQLFEIPLWLLQITRCGIVWVVKKRVFPGDITESGASSSRGLAGALKNSRCSVVKQSLGPKGFI